MAGSLSSRLLINLFLFIFFTLSLHTSSSSASIDAVPRLCIVVNYHIATLPAPDGLDTPTRAAAQWHSLKWAQDACVEHKGNPFSFADADWQPQPSLTLAADFARRQGLSASGGRVRRTITARLSADGQQLDLLNITMEFGLTVKSASASANVYGVMTKSIVAVPLEAAASLPVGWYGGLNRNSAASSLALYDADLFDGTNPAVVDTTAKPPADVGSLIDISGIVRDVAGSPALRQVLFDVLPSALTETARGAFLNASSFAPVTLADVTVGGIRTSAAATPGVGVLLQSQVECRGAECASMPFAEALQRLVASAARSRDLCPTPVLLVDSLRASLSVDLTVGFLSPTAPADLTQSYVRARGMSARSEALFRCSESYVGIALSVSAPLDQAAAYWPLAALTDQRTAVGLVRAIPLVTQGRMAGVLLDSDAARHHVAPFDLFSAHGGGLLLPDHALTEADLKFNVTALFAAIQHRLATSVPLVDALMADLLPSDSNAVAALVDAYVSQTFHPTFFGFLHYIAVLHDSELQVFVSPDGLGATLAMDIARQRVRLSSPSAVGVDAIVSHANAALHTLSVAAVQQFGSLSTYEVPRVPKNLTDTDVELARFFTAVVTINCTHLLDSRTNKTASVDVVTAPRFSAVASVQAQFNASDPTLLFSSAYVTYDFGASTATATAQAGSAAAGVMGSTVGLTRDGQLATDGTWGNPSALRASLDSISADLFEVPWAEGAVQPVVGLDFGEMARGIRLVDMISDLAVSEAISSTQPIDGWTLAGLIQSAIAAYAAGDDTVIADVRVVPLLNAQTMDVSLVIHNQRRFQVATVGTTWDSTADTARLAIPMALITTLRFTVSPSAYNISEFSVRGGGELRGWVIPFTYGMLAGTVTGGSASAALAVNLPGSTHLRVTMAVATEQLALRAQIADEDLVDPRRAVLVVTKADDGVDATLGTPTVTSSRVMSVLSEVILPALPQAFSGTLNVPIPPLDKPLGSITQFGRLLTIIKPWLGSMPASSNSGQLVQSATFCPGATGPSGGNVTAFALNVTVNANALVTCKAAGPLAPASVGALRDDVTGLLASCGLDSYLAVRVLATQTQPDGTECGRVGLFPAVPGIIWSFAIATVSVGGNVSIDGKWITSPKPAFGTWADFARLMAAIFAYDNDPLGTGTAQWTTTNASLVVPPELAAFYPSELPAMSVRVEADHVADDYQFAMQPRISASDGVIQLSSPNATGIGAVASTLSAEMFTIFGGPPLGGRGNISLSTCFDGVNTTTNGTLVPAAPNNTFVLTIGAQVLSTSFRPEWLSVQQLVVLPAGKLLSAALIDDVVPQVNETLRPMLAIYEVPGDGVIHRTSQVRFDLARRQLPDGRWILPTAFGINAVSPLPAIANATNVPSQAVILAKDLLMTLATNVEAAAAAQTDAHGRRTTGPPTAQGRIGVVAFTAARQHTLSRMTVTIAGASKFQALTDLYPSRERFFDSFTVGLQVNNTAVVTGLDVNDVTGAPPNLSAVGSSRGSNVSTPGITFGQVGHYVVDSLDSLKNLTQRLGSWSSSFNGTRRAIDTFRGLLRTNTSICSWIDLADGLAAVLVQTPLVSAQIPFAHRSFGSVLNDNLVASLDSLQSSVCGAHEPFSLGTFCDLVKPAFSGTTTACANVEISDTGLAIDLVVEPFNRTYVDQVRFDTSALFADPSLPVGIGAAGEVTLNVAFDFRLRLLARFGNNGSLVTFGLDREATSFAVAVDFDLQGTVQGNFGPVALALPNSHVWVGSPARLVARLPPAAPAESDAAVTDESSIALVDHHQRSSNATPEVRVSLTGSAGFSAVVGFSTNVQCVVGVEVTDLAAFIAGQMPSVTQRNCGQGFAVELLELLHQQPLLASFGLGFVDQWETGLAQFIDLILVALREGAELPLVGKLVSGLLTDALGQVNGADAVNSLTRAISTITDRLLTKSAAQNEADLEQLVLELFTEALCYEFRDLLVSCPAVPQLNSSSSATEFTWPLHFRGANKRALPHLDVSLGDHGPATLALKCGADLEMEWDLVMVMAFNRSHGLAFRFETSPMFLGDIALEVEPGCELSGTLGWIGADLALHNPKLLEAKLTVDKNLEIDFVADAQVLGAAELGLGGELAERLAKAGPDALDTLPHWQATLNLTWEWDLRHNPHLVPHFAITDIGFCIGRLLTNVIGGTVSQTIDKLLHPLDPVLGPDGILLKPVPGLSGVFGNNMNLAQLLIYACQSATECKVGGLLEMLKTFAQVFSDVESLADISSMLGGEGCNIVQLVRNFTVDFKQAHPEPKFTGAVPPDGLQYKGAAAGNDKLKDAAGGFHRGVTTAGKFGIRLYMFDDLANTMMSAITGKDFAIAGVTLPDVTFFVGMEWPIIVWDPPEVDIIVGVNARLTLSFGGVSLMYSGLAGAFKTKSPGVLFSALALPTKNDDGSVRWPVQAAIGLYGGVAIDIFIFRAETYLTVTLEGDVGFVDLDNDGWVTFNEMAFLIRLNGPAGAIRFRIVLSLGFGIKIQTCINLLAVRFCFTWTDQHWEHSWTLYDSSSNPLDSLAISSGGHTSVNLALVQFGGGKRSADSAPALGCDSCEVGANNNGYNGSSIAMTDYGSAAPPDPGLTFSVFQTPQGITVDFTPAGVTEFGGAPHMSRAGLPASQSLITHGDPGGSAFTWSIGYVTQLVVLPDYDTVTMRYQVAEYRNVSTIALSPQAVTPDTVPGVTITRCAQVHFTKPKAGVTFNVWGLPCPVLLESAVATNISLAGDVAAYAGRLLEIQGEVWSVTSAITATVLNITAKSLIAADGELTAEIGLPAAYKTLSVQGDLKRPSTYIISEVAAGVAARITGGSISDRFVVPDMRLLHGSTLINGGSGDDTTEITIVTLPGVDMLVTANAMGLVLQDGHNASAGNSTTLRHTSIQRRTYIIKGAADTLSNVTLLGVERDDSVMVVAHGEPGGTIVQRITGCDGKSELRVTFQNGGHHEVRIGNNHQVTGMRCTVWLNAVANISLTVHVIIEASAETRPLQYDIQQNTILVYDVENDGSFFHLMFNQIDRVDVQFGLGGSVLRMAEGTVGTEYVFDFGTGAQNATNATNDDGDNDVTNIANIAATDSPLLLLGRITQVNIGPQQSRVGSTDPLKGILAPVAIAQQPPPQNASATPWEAAIVRLAAGTGKAAPAQHYYLDGGCLAAQNRTASGRVTPSHITITPSADMCDLMTAYGLAAACVDPCPVVYTGPINVAIITGWADDSFYGVNVSQASVTMELGPGADNVTWFAAPLATSGANGTGRAQPMAQFDLGPGADSVLLDSPMGNATVLLGRDTDVDVVAFYYGGLSLPPSVHDNVVAPVGPDNAALTLQQVRTEDLLFIYGGRLAVDTAEAAADVVPLATVADGGESRPVVVVNVTVPGQVINMDVQSNVTYRVVGSAQLATVNLNGQGRQKPPFPTASDWDVVVDVASSAQVDVNVLAVPGSRSLTTVNVTGGADVQSVQLESLAPAGLCRTTVGVLEVRTMHVDHIKLDATQCPVDVQVRGTADADLVIVTPNNATESSVRLLDLDSAVLVVNATVVVTPQALLANRTVVAVGPRSQVTVADFVFAGGVSFVDGCLLGSDFDPITAPFSQWLAREAAAVGVNDTRRAAKCSLFAHRADRFNLTAPALYVGGLGATERSAVIRRLVLQRVPASVTIDNIGSPSWRSATVAGSVLGVDGRLEVDLEAGGRLMLTTAVFGDADTSTLDIYATSAASRATNGTVPPLCQWFFGTDDGGEPGGATLLMSSVDDDTALAAVYASSLLDPWHLPLVRLHGPVRLTTQLHNLTDNTTRDVIVESAALQVYESPDVEPLVTVAWVAHGAHSSQPQGSLQIELADGSNRVAFHNVVGQARPFGLPLIIVNDTAVATLTPPSAGASAPAIELLHTSGMQADLDTQFLDPLGSGSSAAQYCFQPNEQCSTNAWLWLSGRLAPWLTTELACRSRDALAACRSQVFASLSLPGGKHRLRALLHPSLAPSPSALPSPSASPSPSPSSLPPTSALPSPSSSPQNSSLPSPSPSASSSPQNASLPSPSPSASASPQNASLPSPSPSASSSPQNSSLPSPPAASSAASPSTSSPTAPSPSTSSSPPPSLLAAMRETRATAPKKPASVPFVLYITAGQADIPDPAAGALAQAAPVQRTYTTSVFVMYAGMTLMGFGWWVITGIVIPAGWGALVITASLAGLLGASTAWDPRVVAVVEGSYWILATFGSSCEPLGAFHVTVMGVFVAAALLTVPALVFKRLRKALPALQRGLTAVTVVMLPFVIVQVPGHDGALGWALFTGLAAVCGLVVLGSYYFHTFKALPSRNRRYFALLPAILMSVVVVVMSILARLRDDNGMPRELFYVAALAALAVDCAASLSSMLVLISLVKGWWRVSPVIISGVAMFFSVGCGLIFLISIEAADAGELALVMWYLWVLLPTAAAIIVMCLPYPVITKPRPSLAGGGSSTDQRPQRELSTPDDDDSARPLLSLNRTATTGDAPSSPPSSSDSEDDEPRHFEPPTSGLGMSL